jgi:hypothetical protein
LKLQLKLLHKSKTMSSQSPIDTTTVTETSKALDIDAIKKNTIQMTRKESAIGTDVATTNNVAEVVKEKNSSNDTFAPETSIVDNVFKGVKEGTKKDISKVIDDVLSKIDVGKVVDDVSDKHSTTKVIDTATKQTIDKVILEEGTNKYAISITDDVTNNAATSKSPIASRESTRSPSVAPVVVDKVKEPAVMTDAVKTANVL